MSSINEKPAKKTLGRIPAKGEVDNGEDEWCWTCGNDKYAH